GHHIVINSGGIFSSVAIVEGGAPVAGIAALSATPSTEKKPPAPVLLQSQRLALMARRPICSVCEATQPRGEADA
ncbi:hypothetical protein MKZ87_00005, partial [Pseudomonas sp. MCal1]|uniref:hypothetical protein n=1 Tax=Pseudomonas sp. MCal1 TaxID=2919887 RepID=UPI00225825ED